MRARGAESENGEVGLARTGACDAAKDDGVDFREESANRTRDGECRGFGLFRG